MVRQASSNQVGGSLLYAVVADELAWVSERHHRNTDMNGRQHMLRGQQKQQRAVLGAHTYAGTSAASCRSRIAHAAKRLPSSVSRDSENSIGKRSSRTSFPRSSRAYALFPLSWVTAKSAMEEPGTGRSMVATQPLARSRSSSTVATSLKINTKNRSKRFQLFSIPHQFSPDLSARAAPTNRSNFSHLTSTEAAQHAQSKCCATGTHP